MKLNYKVWLAGMAGLGLLPCAGLTARANDWADKTTTMVTYFPVPYVSYNTIEVSKKFDIGLNPSQSFVLNLGQNIPSTGSEVHPALNVDQLVIKRGSSSVSRNELTMNSDIYTPSATFGKFEQGPISNVVLRFNNVRLGTNVSPILLDDSAVYVEHFKLFDNKVTTSDLVSTPCTDARWQKVNLGAGEKWYLVCCEGGTCGASCFFANTSENTTKKAHCQASSAAYPNGYPAGNWIQDASPAPQCGCNCPANSTLDGNGYCRCNAGYTYYEGACVASCSVYTYRAAHRSECCASYSGSNQSDAACWDLRWTLQSQEDQCSGVSSAGGACSRLEDYYLEWDYISGVVADEGDPCTTLGATIQRVHYTGAECPRNFDVCGTVTETFECQNAYDDW